VSLSGQIDHSTIVDTGSTDGTHSTAQKVSAGIHSSVIDDA
jgi:hypothetical protein